MLVALCPSRRASFSAGMGGMRERIRGSVLFSVSLHEDMEEAHKVLDDFVSIVVCQSSVDLG